jgi:hypothetical protein
MKIVPYLPLSHIFYSVFSNKSNYIKTIDVLEELSLSNDPIVRNYYVYTDSNCTDDLKTALESLSEFMLLIKLTPAS